MGRFDGQVVIVSGAASGMGASHARGFVDEGAGVVLGDILEEQGRALADELGPRARFSHLDVADQDTWQSTVALAEDAFGPVSVLVNNAAIDRTGLIESMDLDTWWTVLHVNVGGVLLGIRTVTPSMRRAGGGAIVNVSSVAAYVGAPNDSSYVASKWAVRGLTKSAALELGRDGIRVNSIHPGFVDTEMMRQSDMDPAATATFAIPRVADPDELTRLVLFVASADASFSTGSEFVADGGMLLGVPALQSEVVAQ